MALFSTSPCRTGPSLLLNTPAHAHTHIFSRTRRGSNFIVAQIKSLTCRPSM